MINFGLQTGIAMLLLSRLLGSHDVMAISMDYQEEFTLEEDRAFEQLPVVLGAARLKQPQTEAPASVTIIDSDMLELLGVSDVAEVFRLVPGMQVAYYNGHRPVVSYHGTTDINSRRLQVLIDGRSVYQPGLSRILWSELPLSIDDIKQIEVIRGPSSAVYGANAYQATINITTKLPDDSIGFRSRVDFDGRGSKNASISYGVTEESLAIKVGGVHQSSDGFDGQFNGSQRADSRNLNQLNLDVSFTPDHSHSLRWVSGIRSGYLQTDPVNDTETTPFHDIAIDNVYTQVTYDYNINTKHQVKSQLSWSSSQREEVWEACTFSLFVSDELSALVTANRQYGMLWANAAVTGQLPDLGAPPAGIAALVMAAETRLLNNGLLTTCGHTNQNLKEQRLDVEVLDIYNVNTSLRIAGGLNLRQDTADSTTFLGGKADNTIGRLFTHIEWRPFTQGLFNLGAAYEHDDIIGDELSPRLAFNYLLNEQQSLRLIWAEATRTPDLFEEKAHWSYTVSDLSPPVNEGRRDGVFYLAGKAPGHLTSEHIRSFEVGYHYESGGAGIELDIKLYRDHLRDLIENSLDITQTMFTISNGGEANIEGAEFQARLRTEKTLLWLSYAYANVFANTNDYYDRSTPAHSGSALIAYTPNDQSRISMIFYYMDDYLGSRYSRLDAGYMHQLPWYNGRLQMEAVLQTRLDDSTFFTPSSYYDNKSNWLLRLRFEI